MQTTMESALIRSTITALPVEDIETIAEKQCIQFRVRGVFIIRSGFTEALTGKSDDEQQRLRASNSHRACGVTGSVQTVKWFWNKHFAAVAGDMVAFGQNPAA